MGISLPDLMKKSPYLYHVTHEKSLKRILRTKQLESAATLMERAGQSQWLRRRRDSMLDFVVDDDPVVLTDQQPLIENNIEFQGGWTLPDLIEAINRRVFFWRGPASGLLAANEGHQERYEKAGHTLVFLRATFERTYKTNAHRGPEVCRYNSGAPRCTDGKGSPRGPETFIKPRYADFGIRDVNEVVFDTFVELADDSEMCIGSWRGPWKPLFGDG